MLSILRIASRERRNARVERCRWAARFFGFVLLASLHAPLFAQEQDGRARLLTVWSGMLPLIIAAPHGGRTAVLGVPVRRGVGVAQFTIERDGNTAEIAEIVAGKIYARLGAKPFLVVAQFERRFVDANRPENGAYEAAAAKPYYDAYHGALESAVSQVRARWGGGLLLDIHGQSAERDAIFRGTDNGRSVTAMREKHGGEALTGPESILGQLAAKGYRILPDVAGNEREWRYTGGYTTRTYGSHRGTQIDAMQLELGADLRARKNLERTAGDLAEAIVIFARAFLPRSALPANP
jgi:N-formylglutamate amidohydrolase